MTFIEDTSKRLFEEKISSNTPERLFKKLLAEYERGLPELGDKCLGLQQDAQEAANPGLMCKTGQS